MGVTLISHVELASNTNYVNFTGIPQDGLELVLLYSAKSGTSSGSWGSMYTRFNSSSANIYQSIRVNQYYNGVDAGSFANKTYAGENLVPVISQYGENNVAGVGKIHIYDYAQTSYSKPYQIQSNASMYNYAAGQTANISGYWDSTAAITSLQLSVEASGQIWKAGSLFSLYKIS